MVRRLSYLPFLLCLPLGAQEPSPTPTPLPGAAISASLVVSAEALPAKASEIGSATTVLTRDELDVKQQSSLLEVLRTVPGLDIVQSGGSGSATSLFLRGTGSVQTLVLVDGVKLNSPYFGEVDLSPFTTTHVERVEVVRGPYSALYGSDAIGGVVQVFTQKADRPGFAGHATLAAGNDGAREGALSTSYSAGPLRLSAGFRRSMIHGELPNDFFNVTNVSGAAELVLDNVRAGVVVRHDQGRTGVPFYFGAFTPDRSTSQKTLTLTTPVTVTLGDRTTLEAEASYVRQRPTFTDPNDPFGFESTRTDARRYGGRLVVSHRFAHHRVSAGADYDHTDTSNVDTFGVELDGRTTRTWAVFAEDRLDLFADRLSLTVGLRHDRHSTFGGSTNPRAAASFRVVPGLRLRAAAGAGFRSPSTGELFYPFSGNPDLQPEKATSYEVGAEWEAIPALTLETTLFRTSIRNLIEYDFATNRNVNVGRARATGAELAARARLGELLFLRAAYTYLDAVDRDSGEPLLRRPKHRGALTLGARLPRGASAELTAMFVGRRDDVDDITFATVQDPSYVRFDLAVTGPRILDHLAPFVRLTNLLGRDYAEIASHPAPGRRVLAGLDLAF